MWWWIVPACVCSVGVRVRQLTPPPPSPHPRPPPLLLQVLAVFVPLAEYGIKEGDVIRVVRTPYNARTAQSHVRRLRDVLKTPPYPNNSRTPPPKTPAAPAAPAHG
jgi:hypothetical protein